MLSPWSAWPRDRSDLPRRLPDREWGAAVVIKIKLIDSKCGHGLMLDDLCNEGGPHKDANEWFECRQGAIESMEDHVLWNVLNAKEQE